jgi:beta-lactam-binding protein with PASTA domain
MSSYTTHGEFVMVPDFKGKRTTQLEEFIKDKHVNYQIIDSIYDPKEKPGTVLRQDPEMNSKVKHNRTVYLYVTGLVPPQVKMPKLIDRSERQAKLIIHSYGLKVGKTINKHADCNGCVLEQLSGNRIIAQGTGIPKGSVIDLVIGRTDASFKEAVDSTQTEEPESIE